MTDSPGRRYGRPLGAYSEALTLPDPWNPTPNYVQDMPPGTFFWHLVKSTDPQYAHEYREHSDRVYVEECGRRYGPQAFENLTDYMASLSVNDVLAILPDVNPFIRMVAGLGAPKVTRAWATPDDDEVDALAGDTRRKPQANVETYALGHYEQMIVHMAILAATGVDVDLKPEHVEDLKGLRHIFASGHGTVTVTRTNQED